MEKINIGNLHEGHHEFVFTPEAGDFDLGQTDCRELKIVASIEKTGSQLILNGEVSGRFFLDCHRCLEAFSLPFQTGFEIAYKYDYSGELIGKDEDNIKFISPKTVFVNISDAVRDYILLSLPMRAVPPDDNGICAVCKRNTEDFLNPKREPEINPVWEKLLKLKTKD